ncbi:hypothetical protein A7U60_g4548 [Sanghuangporus baumii]|uniref:Uncharacterized protein n=1 Tax=Sanghuangporus baumii TaxID=108892 RepID=A0A9Q5HYG4_SANBA|nr:hypothetical protein A7U60_g4548 [Sanghuangporus baumii]
MVSFLESTSWNNPGKYSLLLALPLLYAFVQKKLLDHLFLITPKLFRAFAGVRLNADTFRSLLPLFFPKSSRYQTYQTQDQAHDYWESAERGQRELSFSDARYSKCSFSESRNTRERQILYYMPRLLPEYRYKRSMKDDLDTDFSIPTKAFMKWHWLVFPDRVCCSNASVMVAN